MKRFALRSIAALACSLPFAAHAQIGLFGELAATHDSNAQTWYKGFTGGGYANAFNLGPLHLGLGLRGSYKTGNSYTYRNFVVGPRLEVRPPAIPISPYIEGVAGVGNLHVTSGSSDTKVQYGVIGGLNYTVFPHIDLRLPDIEYLHMSSGSQNPTLNLLSLGIGVVVRL